MVHTKGLGQCALGLFTLPLMLSLAWRPGALGFVARVGACSLPVCPPCWALPAVPPQAPCATAVPGQSGPG